MLAATLAVAARDSAFADSESDPAADRTRAGGIAAGAQAQPGSDPAELPRTNLPCADCGGGGGTDWVQCTFNDSFAKSTARGQSHSRVRWSAIVTCRGSSIHLSPVEFSGRTVLYDRTAGRNKIIGYGSSVSGQIRHNNAVSSSGDIVLLDANYDVGKDVEVVLEATLTYTGITNWDYCTAAPELHVRLIDCQGQGTKTLRGTWGTGTFPTGLQQQEVCREDNTPRVFSGLTYTVTVTPHIRHCGYFNDGPTGRVTRVEKLRPTGLTASGILACNLAFFPDPNNDGETYLSGREGKFEVQVRLQLGLCDLVGTGVFLKDERTYLSDGNIEFRP